jgi:hypothetical protein
LQAIQSIQLGTGVPNRLQAGSYIPTKPEPFAEAHGLRQAPGYRAHSNKPSSRSKLDHLIHFKQTFVLM